MLAHSPAFFEDKAVAQGRSLDQLDSTPYRRKRCVGPRPFRLEYRWRKMPATGLEGLFGDPMKWKPYKAYATAARRDQALTTLMKSDRMFEYRRPPEMGV